jgi:hypothetical protein
MVKNLSPLNMMFKTVQFDFDGEGDVLQSFRWINLEDLTEDDVTFPADKHVVKLLLNSI